ncbi:MAG: aminotransferase class I/II-fold pyridoxal phosphate-dependent enzyme [Saprospiraceae bacterium]|nr:aminotransferase class I/II-fold pyridoxal phosphate-dependent enzyme [Saprospiraceae bacterium]
MSKKISFQSTCVKEFQRNESTKPHQLPLYATSSFDFEKIEDGIDIFTGQKTGHVYSRYGNPTVDTVANKLAHLEAYGTDLNPYGWLTSSGMSAISTLVIGTLNQGDKILTQGNLYGGTTELFIKVLGSMGIQPIFINLKDKEAVSHKLEEDSAIKMIYLETPANPTLACIDIEWIADLAKSKGVLTAIDNTFCTPLIQQPLALGIDFVVHSTTKYINGHGNSIAGVIIGHLEEYKKGIWTTLKLAGTNCNPWDAWLINNGIKTLGLRMERHCSNAQTLAEYLEQHEKVSLVNYTGLKSHPDHELAKKQMKGHGGMLSFEIKAGKEAALAFMNKVQFCSLAPTLGDVDTLILHPATSSHLNVDKELREANGISDGLIRVSVGIEDINDIISDIEQAL